MRCSKRKEIIEVKRKQERERNNITYVNVTKTNTQPDSYRPPINTTEDMLRLNTWILHAHYRNIENPGTYKAELDKILKLNNLSNIKIPENPNSNKILNITVTRPTPATKKEKTINLPDTRTKEKEEEGDIDFVESLEEMEKELLPTCTAKDVGLEL